ncbi:MAG: formylglycine-generating enzyme family protein [Isosphaeraceae bacterium]
MAIANETLKHLHPLARGIPPEWAWEWGDDRYGPWCSFHVKGVGQRLRWIPPGRFMMGSPTEETGRFEDEGPQRIMQFFEGFWLFDTPCTQELWEAVMGQSPSRFPSPTRPVEQVGWEDAQAFVERLNESLDGLGLSLPSEAQWEYACRAGTTGATYAGDLDILGESNAPVLDGIAWYRGNCGVGFELAEGIDISSWSEKQYESKTGGTHPEGSKAPNAWGLYDMLGNVWEWCLDPYRAYGEVSEAAAPASAARVIRGGSWFDVARFVRAACRYGIVPGHRYSFLGFRCAEFQAGHLSEG